LSNTTVTRLVPESFDWSAGTGGASDVRRILDEATAHDGRAALNEAAVLTLQNHNLEAGVLLVADQDGFAYVHGLYGAGRPELDLVVAPSARRQGIGTALARATGDLLDGIPLTAWSHGNHPGAAALAASAGFVKARELWLMRRPSSAELPKVAVPADVVIRQFVVGQDEEGLLAVNAAAFSDHPEQKNLDRRGLDERIAEQWFDATGFLVASRDDEILGFHWTKVHAGSPPHGEVYVIGVHPSQQGTGLGRALLIAGLAHLKDLGLGEVVLYVEADNHPAIQLYGSMGFTHAEADTDVMYAPAGG
jgi:mycothiol synthase